METSILKFWASTLLLALLTAQARAQPPNVPRQRVHVYLLAGQSNMAGRGTVDSTDRSAGRRKLHPRIWTLNKANQWVPAAEPLHFDKPDVVGVGPGLAFARVMVEADTSALIALVPTAQGGSAIDSWTPGGYHEQTKSHPYDDALSRAKIALSSGTLKGILWHQGESDSKPELVSTYADKLSRLIARFRAELDVPDLPVVVGTLGDFYEARTPSAIQVNQAIRAVAKRERQMACIEATGLIDKGDKTHFDASSARELGRRYAEAMLKLQSENR